MKIFYNPELDLIVETEKFDGFYRIDFMQSVVLYVFDFKTIQEAKKKNWFYIGSVD